MKRACPRTTGEKGTIAAAVSLLPCHPSREVLKSVWQFCFKSNPDWYRTHGVGLQDISKNIGKWQSLQVPEEPVPLVDKKRDPNAPELGVSGLPKFRPTRGKEMYGN